MPQAGLPQMGVAERDTLYRLMISQLFYDGHQSLAVQLSQAIKAHPACPPSDRLLKVCTMGLKVEEEMSGQKKLSGATVAPGTGIDLEYETDVQTISPEAAQYETCYVTAHKGPCRSGTFHWSGQLIATGSEDASIKILDVERMLSKSATPAEILAQETHQQQMENHPVIRTLYDHSGEVTTLDFHPIHQILASGSSDYSIKFFEFSKPSVKKAYKSIQEASEVTSIHFHPSGEYLLAGTKHHIVRLYDVNTFQCFVCSNPKEHHQDSVTCVNFAPQANHFVTSSIDGNIKLWDGVSHRCVATFKNAHDGLEVCTVKFSRNGKYVLSSGKDSLVKLWELSTSRCLIAYTGAGATGKQQFNSNATFNHTEDYVLFPDERTTSLCCWDSRNADRQRLLALGHNDVVRTIAHSPTGPAFVTCSDDYRARFWYRKAETD